MKVLLLMDHSPDYREAFLRELGQRCQLTVLSQPCEIDNLTPPATRLYYNYIEIKPFSRLGLRWQPMTHSIIKNGNWDIICCGLNLRQVNRLFSFLASKNLRKKWIWRGHIIGRSKLRLVHYLKKFFLSRSAGCLTYSDFLVQKINYEFGIKSASFNNTEVKKDEFIDGQFNDNTDHIRLLFVGRNQERKKLFRLVELAKHNKNLYIRIIGPGTDQLEIPEELINESRVQVYGKTVAKALKPHFDWADLVVNPGHVGLLVMNAARHQKGIVIDSTSDHAPEFYLAKQSKQPFIDFSDIENASSFFENLRTDKESLKRWGLALQDTAKKQYTIESMARIHIEYFRKIKITSTQ